MAAAAALAAAGRSRRRNGRRQALGCRQSRRVVGSKLHENARHLVGGAQAKAAGARAGLASEFQISRKSALHAVEGCPDHGIAQLPGADRRPNLVLFKRASQAGDAGDCWLSIATTPSAGAQTSKCSGGCPDAGGCGRRRVPPGRDDRVHLRQARPGVEGCRARWRSVAAAHAGVEFNRCATARRKAFWRRSSVRADRFSTRITSRASSTGQSRLPIGWRPSVMTTADGQVHAPGDELKQGLRKLLRFGHRAHFAAGPIGISTPVGRTAKRSFDGWPTICPARSMDSGRSTEISTSSAGEAGPCPPARQPRWSPHDALQVLRSASTLANTPWCRAVPAGDVMARDDVLGTQHAVRRHDGHHQHVGTVAGMPPMQCLSTTKPRCQSSCWPVATMASEGNTSSRVNSSRLHATTKAVSSILNSGARRYRTMAQVFAQALPAILRNSAPWIPGGSACATATL